MENETQQLKYRLEQIKEMIRVLSQEQQYIEQKLNNGNNGEDPFQKNKGNNESIDNNRKEEGQKEVERNIEDNSSNQSVVHTIDPKDKLREEKYQRMTNFNSLKYYFEQDQDIDISSYSSQYTGLRQEGTDDQKKARLKTFHFQLGGYIDFYDEQIEKAVLTKKEFQLSRDELNQKAQPFFDALIKRSEVIALYKSCEEKSGNLSEMTPLGISEISTVTVRCYYLLTELCYFLQYQRSFDWDYHKIRGVFDLWEGGFASSEGLYEGEINTFSYKLKALIKNKGLTEQQKESFSAMIFAVNDLVQNGWYNQRNRKPEKNMN